jgi:hypothetical protein
VIRVHVALVDLAQQLMQAVLEHVVVLSEEQKLAQKMSTKFGAKNAEKNGAK